MLDTLAVTRQEEAMEDIMEQRHHYRSDRMHHLAYAEMPLKSNYLPQQQEMGSKERKRRQRERTARRAAMPQEFDAAEVQRQERASLPAQMESQIVDSAKEMSQKKKELLKEHKEYAWAKDETLLAEHIPLISRIRAIEGTPIRPGYSQNAVQVIKDDLFRYAAESAKLDLHRRALTKVVAQKKLDVDAMGDITPLEQTILNEDKQLLKEYDNRIDRMTHRMQLLEIGLTYLHGQTDLILQYGVFEVLKEQYHVDIQAHKKSAAKEGAMMKDVRKARVAAANAAFDAQDWDALTAEFGPDIKETFKNSTAFKRVDVMMKPLGADSPEADESIRQENLAVITQLVRYEATRNKNKDTLPQAEYEAMKAMLTPFAERLQAFDTSRFFGPDGAVNEKAVREAQSELLSFEYAQRLSDLLKIKQEGSKYATLRKELCGGDKTKDDILTAKMNVVTTLIAVSHGLALEYASGNHVFNDYDMLVTNKDAGFKRITDDTARKIKMRTDFIDNFKDKAKADYSLLEAEQYKYEFEHFPEIYEERVRKMRSPDSTTEDIHEFLRFVVQNKEKLPNTADIDYLNEKRLSKPEDVDKKFEAKDYGFIGSLYGRLVGQEYKAANKRRSDLQAKGQTRMDSSFLRDAQFYAGPKTDEDDTALLETYEDLHVLFQFANDVAKPVTAESKLDAEATGDARKRLALRFEGYLQDLKNLIPSLGVDLNKPITTYEQLVETSIKLNPASKFAQIGGQYVSKLLKGYVDDELLKEAWAIKGFILDIGEAANPSTTEFSQEKLDKGEYNFSHFKSIALQSLNASIAKDIAYDLEHGHRQKREDKILALREKAAQEKAAQERAEEERRIAEEEQRKAEEERRIAEEEQQKAENERRMAEEEQRVIEEEKRKADIARQKADLEQHHPEDVVAFQKEIERTAKQMRTEDAGLPEIQEFIRYLMVNKALLTDADAALLVENVAGDTVAAVDALFADKRRINEIKTIYTRFAAPEIEAQKNRRHAFSAKHPERTSTNVLTRDVQFYIPPEHDKEDTELQKMYDAEVIVGNLMNGERNNGFQDLTAESLLFEETLEARQYVGQQYAASLAAFEEHIKSLGVDINKPITTYDELKATAIKLRPATYTAQTLGSPTALPRFLEGIVDKELLYRAANIYAFTFYLGHVNNFADSNLKEGRGKLSDYEAEAHEKVDKVHNEFRALMAARDAKIRELRAAKQNS
ncbi:MAG: hypothetical protein LBR44_01030 [Clostridiales Family XIII bacterium]|jgi:hypothetical protein|nr:hypothetical protein [Clostridiales Family XIII bacterium]